MAVAVLSMGSCQEYDFSFTEQDVFKGAYERNFTNTFGNIDSDETWDFSEYGDLTRASISYNSVCQYAQGNGETHGVKWYEVQQGTLNWIVDNLPEFKNNTANTTGGNSFSFFMKKGQSIEILPIYVGYATMSWELHMVAVKAKNGQDLDIVFYPPPRPTNIPADYDCMILGVEDLNKSNDAGGSDGGYSDWDFNDIVFLVTGKLPEVVRETKTLTSTIKKRYMIEDLGSTFDQDFNDMVVDVEQTTTVVMKLEDGEIKSQSSTVEQKATVKHLGGTLPIQIKVGDYTFGRVTNPMNLTLTQQQLQDQESDNHETNSGIEKNVGIDPEISATITGWNPATNNIVCYVWKIADVENTDPNTSDIWRVEFPESGVAPFIIAVDPSTPWTAEHVLAPINDWRAGNPADYSPVN